MDELKKAIIKYEVEDYSLYSRECCKSIERIEGIERLEISIPEQLAESIFLNAAEKINQKIKSNDFIIGRKKERKNEKLLFYDDKFNSGMIQGVIGVIYVNDVKIDIADQEDNSYDEPKYETYDVQITVKSRFDKDSKAYFLATMLFNADTELNKDNIDFSYDDIFDFLLVLLFKRNFLEAYKNGFYRTYQYFEKNDERLKGRIDIARHVKMNAGMDNGKIAYSYRENTVDNSFNHLILHTYMYMKNRFPDLVDKIIDGDFEIRKALDELRFNAGSYVSYDIRSIMNKCQKPISHPLYFTYEHLRIVCLDILNNLGLSIFDGNEKEVQGMLYYIPDLWEEFLENKLLYSMKYKPESQMEIKVFNRTKKTYPDFVFKDKQDKPFYILDAKFKPGWYEAYDKGNLGNKLDDYTKCIRDMNSIGAHAVGVIFPTNEGEVGYEDSKVISEISKYNERDEFHCIPVHVPSSEEERTYEAWLNEFNISIKNTAECIEKTLLRTEAKERLYKIEDEIGILNKYNSHNFKDIIDTLTNEMKEFRNKFNITDELKTKE